MNWLAIIVATLVPMVMGALYYGPLFEKTWLDSLGYTKKDFEGRNDAVIYGLALLMAFLVSWSLKMLIELVHKDVNSSGELIYASFHTFGHGAFHGALIAATTVIPVIVSLSLFQKNSAKNILLNVGFWLICFTLMGGIIDVWN